MKLVIVESPTKAKTLSRFLGGDYQIEATMGHIRDLPEKKLGIEIIVAERAVEVGGSARYGAKPRPDGESPADSASSFRSSLGSHVPRSSSKLTALVYDFIPQYELMAKKKETIDKIREEAKKAEKIILATDPDREGEAIAWHVAQILEAVQVAKVAKVEQGKKTSLCTSSTFTTCSTLSRIVFHEITEAAINEALANPREIDMNLVDAQQARRVLDRLVGYKLSPLLWRKIRRGLSAGRVQSVAVRLIVEREREIKAFKSEEYWTIQAELTPGKSAGHEFSYPSDGALRSGAALATVQTGLRSSLGGTPPRAPIRSEQSKIGRAPYVADLPSFLATLVSKNEKKVEIKNKEEADRLLAELQNLTYQVKNIEVGEAKKYPYPPFTTSTLQQAAANLFGWTSKRTMQIAQKLYEEGLITYHRTDSLSLAQQAIFDCRNFIKSEYGTNYLPEQPKFYKTKSKVAQEAHEAIRPTRVTLRSATQFSVASNRSATSASLNDSSRIGGLPASQFEGGRDEKRLYDLIWKRFVACQMKEAVYEETKVEIEAGSNEFSHRLDGPAEVGTKIFSGTKPARIPPSAGFRPLKNFVPPRVPKNEFLNANSALYLFRANGSQLKFDGWKRVYINEKWETENDEKGNTLPALKIGEILKLIKLWPGQHFTEPPARYTEATLIKALEEKGIGRPSTYAPIISTIQERQYVEKSERKFVPTVLGETVNDFLVGNFAEIMEVGFTAKMEDELDEIANGKRKWTPVIADFYGPFEKKLTEVQEKAKRVVVPVEETDEKCPECQATLVVRLGRFGKFLACSKFPECKFTKPFIQKTGLTCPKCGGEIVIKKTKRGKQFYGCLNYPKCDFAAWRKNQIGQIGKVSKNP